MKKILIYGDSNVWGDNFITRKRIPDDKQWVNILQNKLGENYRLFQEGLPGRIAGEEDEFYKNGKSTFKTIFRTHSPLDIIIISLGENDLQIKYNKDANQIINDLLWYKEFIENMDEDDKERYCNNKIPKIIYILPFNFNDDIIFDKTKEEERKKIIEYFNKNNIDNIYFNDIELFEDGIHLSYEGHKKLSEKLFEVLIDE